MKWGYMMDIDFDNLRKRIISEWNFLVDTLNTGTVKNTITIDKSYLEHCMLSLYQNIVFLAALEDKKTIECILNDDLIIKHLH